MPHYVILSPFEHPITYGLFAITWLSCLISALVAIYFYRQKKGGWWLLIAVAVLLPLIFEITICLSHGLPPLPYSLDYPEQKLNPSHIPTDLLEQGKAPETEGTISFSVSRVQWSFYPPLMAIALGWAYLADRKKRADEAPTAQT